MAQRGPYVSSISIKPAPNSKINPIYDSSKETPLDVKQPTINRSSKKPDGHPTHIYDSSEKREEPLKDLERLEKEKKVKQLVLTGPDRQVEIEDPHGQVSRLRARLEEETKVKELVLTNPDRQVEIETFHGQFSRLRARNFKKTDDEKQQCPTDNSKFRSRPKEETKAKELILNGHDKIKSEQPISAEKQMNRNLRDANERMKQVNEDLRGQVRRLRASLSMVTEGNAFVADLNDPVRPQKLVDKFTSLCDNSWTEAYTGMKKREKDEQLVCAVLLKMFKVCWEYCLDFSKKQLYTIRRYCADPRAQYSLEKTSSMAIHDEYSVLVSGHLKHARRLCVRQFIPLLCQHFWEKMKREESEMLRYVREESIKSYIDTCIDLSWLSAICDPPIYYSFTAENLDDFRGCESTPNGNEVQFVLLPAMYLHQNGTRIHRGVVKFKPIEYR